MALNRINEITTTIPAEAGANSNGFNLSLWLVVIVIAIIAIVIYLELKKKKKQRDVEKELHEKYINEGFVHNEGYLELYRFYPVPEGQKYPIAVGGGLQNVIHIVGSQTDGTDGFENIIGYTSPKIWANFIWKWPFFTLPPFNQFKPFWYKLFYELFVIRVPRRRTVKVAIDVDKDENGKAKRDSSGQLLYKYQDMEVPKHILIKNPLSRKIILICEGLQKIRYNYYPLYKDSTKQIINWEQVIIPMEVGHIYQDATRMLANKVTELAELRADADENEQKIRKRGAESSTTRSE